MADELQNQTPAPVAPEATPAPDAAAVPEAPTVPGTTAPLPDDLSPTSYQARLAELEAERAKVSELEAQINEGFLRLDAPVETWKVGEYLDGLRDKAGAYYDKLGWAILERHLPQALPVFLQDPSGLPPQLRPMVEQTAVNIITGYTGLSEQDVINAITQYKQGGGGMQTATGMQAQPEANVQQLAYQYNLDPANAEHAALLNHILATGQQLQSVQGQLDKFQQTQTERETQETMGRLNSTIEGIRGDILGKVAVPQGYESYKGRIENLARFSFDSDPVVQQARANAEAYYRQGTPDLRAAAGELAKIQTRMSYHIKEASDAILAPIVELENLKSQISAKQEGVKNFPPNAGTAGSSAAPSGAGLGPMPTDPKGWAERAALRYRESQLAKQGIPNL